MSLRCAELRRCAPSEADEERASPERNMWMPGRQRNALVCLCALVRRRRVYAVCVRRVRSPCAFAFGGADFKEVCC